jgi:hypothetical protein
MATPQVSPAVKYWPSVFILMQTVLHITKTCVVRAASLFFYDAIE